MRKWAVDPEAPGVAAAAGSDWGIYGPLLVTLALCAAAAYIFRRKSRTLGELL